MNVPEGTWPASLVPRRRFRVSLVGCSDGLLCPGFVASSRAAKNPTGIILLGWTVLGWAIALTWYVCAEAPAEAPAKPAVPAS